MISNTIQRQHDKYILDSSEIKLTLAKMKSSYITNKPNKIRPIIEEWNRAAMDLPVTNKGKLVGVHFEIEKDLSLDFNTHYNT